MLTINGEKMLIVTLTTLITVLNPPAVFAFCWTSSQQLSPYRSFIHTKLLSTPTSSLDDNAELYDESDDEYVKEREKLKSSLIALGASYDRGFGATPSSRSEAEDIIDRLENLNPTINASQGIDGDEGFDAPLRGAWRMVWTTAQDVLLLGASPIATVGAIYQVIDPPVATNIIDLIPRSQALLPPGIVPSLLRAEVTTKASSRGSLPLRVGLTFEKVNLQPVEILGAPVKDFLPPIGWNLPSISNIPGFDEESSPGYFDVSYLDNELLIIKQNAPGGLFALIKVENYDP